MLKSIGKYEIIEEIGQGAMGVVYKARDPFLGRLVALKTITGGLSGKADLLERFYQEGRSAGGLQHPNIVTIFELGKADDIPYIAMEYLEGESLEKLIARRDSMALSQKVGYIVQICGALDYAHKHGLIHRDIKPGNIMLNKEGAVKVVDFGIARVIDASKTQTGMLIGTLGYMSPQQIRGERADERADIWAVGVMFYEILGYQRPFNGDNPAALMLNIITQKPQPLRELAPDCPPDVGSIIDRMMNKEAGLRFQSMEDVLLELDPLWRRLQREKLGELVAESQKLIEGENLQKAQSLLRQAIHLDSSNTQAKSLLEHVSAELRRVHVLPRIKDQLAKAQGLFDNGRLQEAKTELNAALQLDSKFPEALDLLAQVDTAIRRAQTIQENVRNAKKRVAEQSWTEAGRLIDEVLALDPSIPAAQELQRQIRDARERRDKQKRLTEGLQKGRSLWARAYYDECIDLLLELQKEFPQEAEIPKLLESARQDKKDEKKQLRLTDARNLLDAKRFAEALSLLNEVAAAYPNDAAVKHLRTLVVQAQETQEKRKRLDADLVELRQLVKDGKLEEAFKKGEPLARDFPQENELVAIVKSVRTELQNVEQKRLLDESVKRVRGLIDNGLLPQAIQAAEKALTEHSGNVDLMILLERAQNQQREKEKREFLEKRIREVKGKINRDELTDAIDLARETLMTVGDDTDVSQLLHAAEMEHAHREKKKEQDRQFAAAQTFVAKGNFSAATQVLNQALATQIFDSADPKLRSALKEIEDKKRERERGSGQKKAPAGGGGPGSTPQWPGSTPGEPAKDYVYSATSFRGGPAQSEASLKEAPAGMLATTIGSASTPAAQRTPAVRGTAAVAEEMPASTAMRPVWKQPIPLVIGGVVLAAAIGTGVYVTHKLTAPAQAPPQQSQTAQQQSASGAAEQSVPQQSSSGPQPAPLTTPQARTAPPQQTNTRETQPQTAQTKQAQTQTPAPQSQQQAANQTPLATPARTQPAQPQPAAQQPPQIAQQIQPAPMQQAPQVAPPPAQTQPTPAPVQPTPAPAAQPQPAPTAATPKAAAPVVSQPAVRLQVGERKKYSGPLNSGQIMSSAFLDEDLRLNSHEVPASVITQAKKGTSLTLLLFINEDGRIYEARVLAGDQQVGAGVAAAAKQNWQVDPPKVNGKPVKTTVSAAIQF